jgi:23S rRNA pseudouridine2605 synthase
MRINRFVATATGLSRRTVDTLITQGQVRVNDTPAKVGQDITPDDVVTYNGKTLRVSENMQFQTILLNKPAGYVCSRNGQGSRTIYDLLPEKLHRLKPVGRLDKDSSGLLLLTDDGDLAHQLTHPSFRKIKTYEIVLDKPLTPLHRQMISDHGVQLEDGPSKLQLERKADGIDTLWQITMHEGRNRQIRRTFEALGYNILKLHRTTFGPYTLDNLRAGAFNQVY